MRQTHCTSEDVLSQIVKKQWTFTTQSSQYKIVTELELGKILSTF